MGFWTFRQVFFFASTVHSIQRPRTDSNFVFLRPRIFGLFGVLFQARAWVKDSTYHKRDILRRHCCGFWDGVRWTYPAGIAQFCAAPGSTIFSQNLKVLSTTGQRYFNRICEGKLENCRKFWNLWKLFIITDYYAFVALDRMQRVRHAAGPKPGIFLDSSVRGSQTRSSPPYPLQSIRSDFSASPRQFLTRTRET